MHRIFVDSNVLGSKTLYDWLFQLRLQSNMFALCTSDDVIDEAHRVWRRRKPEVGGAMRKNRDGLFRTLFDEILSDWAGGVVQIPDLHDTHVYNAAAHAKVDILLTANVSDFGDPDTLPFDLYTPDELFCLIESNHPDLVLEVSRDQVKHWSKIAAAGGSVVGLSQALEKAGCPDFAAAVERHLRLLAGPATPEVIAS